MQTFSFCPGTPVQSKHAMTPLLRCSGNPGIARLPDEGLPTCTFPPAAAAAFSSSFEHFPQSANPSATSSHRATASRSVSWILKKWRATSKGVRPYLSLAKSPRCIHEVSDVGEDSSMVLVALSRSFKAPRIICTAKYLPPAAALWSGVDSSPKLDPMI